MLISFKMGSSEIKLEPGEEITPEDDNANKPLEFADQDFDYCAGCKAPFKGAKIIIDDPNPETTDNVNNEAGEEMDIESGPRRGQQGTIESFAKEGRKVKEFYSYNLVTGELLRVTALQAMLSVFELRLCKSFPGNTVNLQEANENLGLCPHCATLISQLYKLHQEVTGLIQDGSVLSKLIGFETELTESQETDFTANTKKRKRTVKGPQQVNGISSMVEDMDQDNSPWTNHNDDNTANDPDWNNDDDHFGGDHEEPTNNTYGGESDDNQEVNVKPSAKRLKITSVASTKSYSEDEHDETPRRRRASTRKVDYKKVLEGDDDDDDDDWQMERKSHKASTTTARKKTGGTPASASKSRGRPKKAASTSSSSSKNKSPNRDGAFKSPLDKREATCQLCRKTVAVSYLAEHMKVAHANVAGQSQPCLICGKIFENSYKAIKHLLTHVPEKAYGCSRCHETFKTSDERNSHTNSEHDPDKKMDCPKCTQSFTSLLLLNKHEAQKHRQTKSFLCSICAKLLTGKDEWIQHILSHGPFQCYHCKEFLKPTEYKRHVQTMHAAANRLKPNASGVVVAEVTLD